MRSACLPMADGHDSREIVPYDPRSATGALIPLIGTQVLARILARRSTSGAGSEQTPRYAEVTSNVDFAAVINA